MWKYQRLFMLSILIIVLLSLGCTKDDNIVDENTPGSIVPNNEIWYTNGSTTKPTMPIDPTTESVWPYDPLIFGANIVSHTYDVDKECWVIRFNHKVTRIGEFAFNDRRSITSVALPDSVTTIQYSAFKGCTQLTTITLGISVTKIGYGAFYGCSSLTSIVLPDSVTTIDSGAFNGCSNLESITLGNGVVSIGTGAFAHCANLSEVALPDCVTTIRMWAFNPCDSLTSLYCKAVTPPVIEESTIDPKTTIYVPVESVDAYKSAAYWSEYTSNIVGYNFN